MMITPSATVAGHRITRTLGLVRGNTIRARHVGKDILAGFRNIVGGEVSEYTKMMAESREQALDRMVAEAEEAGADAIVNLRFATSYVMGSASEILAYGDAVKLEKEPEVTGF
ncbi:MAG: YbjQ family protein [Gemmatimonadota bacterium]